MLAQCLYIYGGTKRLTWHVRSLSFKTAVLGWGCWTRKACFSSRLIGRLLLASCCLKPKGKTSWRWCWLRGRGSSTLWIPTGEMRKVIGDCLKTIKLIRTFGYMRMVTWNTIQLDFRNLVHTSLPQLPFPMYFASPLNQTLVLYCKISPPNAACDKYFGFILAQWVKNAVSLFSHSVFFLR